MSSRIPVPGLPEPKFRPLTELEDDAYRAGGPQSSAKKPSQVLTNKEEFEEVLQRHLGATRVKIDIDF